MEMWEMAVRRFSAHLLVAGRARRRSAGRRLSAFLFQERKGFAPKRWTPSLPRRHHAARLSRLPPPTSFRPALFHRLRGALPKLTILIRAATASECPAPRPVPSKPPYTCPTVARPRLCPSFTLLRSIPFRPRSFAIAAAVPCSIRPVCAALQLRPVPPELRPDTASDRAG